MNWNKLTDERQLEELTKESHHQPVLIFKHSSRCSISYTVLARLERSWNETEMNVVKTYFLDLLSFRKISASIADQFLVEHQSPQVLLIRDGQSFYDRSHMEIDYNSMKVELLGKK